jgi:hypothetical protein
MTVAIPTDKYHFNAQSKDQKTVNGQPFPYIVSPSNDSQISKDDLLTYVKENKALFFELMLEYGAVVLRGFDLKDGKDFQDVLDQLDMEELPYVGESIIYF